MYYNLEKINLLSLCILQMSNNSQNNLTNSELTTQAENDKEAIYAENLLKSLLKTLKLKKFFKNISKFL